MGGDFSHGLMDWAIVTFDRATSKEQRDAIATIVGSVYPVKWNSLTTAEGDMSWTAGKDEARALLDGGKTAEVSLKRFAGMTDEPIVIRNLKYWGAPRNDGFVLMPNTVEAFRAGSKPFEYKADGQAFSVNAPAPAGEQAHAANSFRYEVTVRGK